MAGPLDVGRPYPPGSVRNADDWRRAVAARRRSIAVDVIDYCPWPGRVIVRRQHPTIVHRPRALPAGIRHRSDGIRCQNAAPGVSNIHVDGDHGRNEVQADGIDSVPRAFVWTVGQNAVYVQIGIPVVAGNVQLVLRRCSCPKQKVSTRVNFYTYSMTPIRRWS